MWGIQVNKGTEQRDLRISSPFEPFVTVDNIEVAQFTHLLLNNQEIRNVIGTITSKVVLILGRFSDDRKVVLDHLRDELRKHSYLPIMFDFEPSAHRTTVETIKTLAGMARFVIVDLTDDSGRTERRFWGDLPVHVAGAHPKGRRLRAGDVGPYVVAFMDQGPIERRSLLAFDLQGKGVTVNANQYSQWEQPITRRIM